MLTHFRVRPRLGAYLDGALDDAGARQTERHLTTCATCQAEVAQLRKMKALLADVAAVREPDWTGFFPGIVRGIDAERRVDARVLRTPARRLWPQWAMGGAALASAALALVLWQGGRAPEQAEAAVQVHAATTEDPGSTVMVYTPAEKDLAVVWVFDNGAD